MNIKTNRRVQAEPLFDRASMPKAVKRDTKFRSYKYNFHGRHLTLQGYERHALEFLVNEMGIKPCDIVCECENDFANTLKIRYKYRGEMHTYLPDAYVVSKRTVIEVKSIHTLGLRTSLKRGWSMTCAKARATKAKGYNIILMLMQDDGSRIPLPKGWYDMKKAEVVKALAPHLDKTNIDGVFDDGT